jgi:two-component system cell cycle response regulator
MIAYFRYDCIMTESSPNILLVDDLSANLLALESVLEGMECNTFTALSGQAALRLVLKHHFELALLDVQMPHMDGFELAQFLRGRKETRDIQIIFVTAISKEQQYVERGYELGAISYLFKPVDPDELRNKVNAALKWSTFNKTVETLDARKREIARKRSAPLP